MKKIEAVIKPFKLDEIKEALTKEKIHRITVFEVKGAGSQEGKAKEYRALRYIEDSAQVKVKILAKDDEVEHLTHTIMTVLWTGQLCDGQVAVLPVERLVRVRLGACS
jgi:nitrogen regulatory protein P-II 1